MNLSPFLRSPWHLLIRHRLKSEWGPRRRLATIHATGESLACVVVCAHILRARGCLAEGACQPHIVCAGLEQC